MREPRWTAFLACALALGGCATPNPMPSAYPSDTPPSAVTSASIPTDSRREQFVDSILALMTLEEKLGQLNQPGGPGPATGPAQRAGSEADVRAGRIGSYLGGQGAVRGRELQRIAVEESRLGIPLLFAHDVIHGYRTIFPVPLGEAASFDPAAVERASRIAAIEASADGIMWTYAPMVDIAREPRWGRIVEGAGEDPYLGSQMAAARVRGFQGEDLAADNTLLATAKHFVGYGAAEGGRDYNVGEISERTLREIYLPPFRAAIEAGAGSVMGAFNEVAGVPMHAHEGLIDGLLRAEWGWDGVLISDYTGVMELLHHGVAVDSAHAGVLAVEAGVDIDMVSRIYVRHLPAMVRQGRLAESDVDDAVRRVLRAKYDLGLFENPYQYTDSARLASSTMRPEFIRAARDLARKSIVLLKNDLIAGAPLLPLRKDAGTIAVIGALATDRRSVLGGWAAAGRAEDGVTVLEGIEAAVAAGTDVQYARGAPVDSIDRSGFAEAVRMAESADVVILVVGEHHDMSAEARNRTSLDLPGVQQELVEAVHATGTPVVVVLMNGRPLAIQWMADNVPAILETWFLGVQMGPAVADVLFGDYNPAGRLPVTMPRNVGQVPIYYNHKNTGRPPSEGERYTSKYIDVPWTPLYPFGHGLSYTTFGYSVPRLSSPSIRADGTLTLSVDVTNTGARAGDEVVQLYVRDEVASVTPAVKRLRGFERITLPSGERRTVSFTLGPDDLALWDIDMRHVVEPGWFTVYVGGSSEDVQAARFQVSGAVFEVTP